MTSKAFWDKLDKASENENKMAAMMEVAVLLKQAYEEDLKIMIGCSYSREYPGMAFQSYMEWEGKRAMICFTSKAEARRQKGCEAWDIAKVRDIMNNMFNKPVIGALLFNGDSKEKMVLVPKEMLNDLIPGEKPLPPHFRG